MVAAGGDDAGLHVWDLATHEPIGSPMTGHTEGIERMGVATIAGRTVAVTGSPGDIRVWTSPENRSETRSPATTFRRSPKSQVRPSRSSKALAAPFAYGI